jgi:hypothetical protein
MGSMNIWGQTGKGDEVERTDRFNLLPPSICIICEESPSGDLVDTGRVLKTGVASALNGRKYVCERCVGEFAKLFGYEKGENVKQAKIDVEFAERQVARIRTVVRDFANYVAEAIEHPGVTDEVKPEVEDVFPEQPVQRGGTTEGVYKADDTETPAVPSPGVASAAAPVEDEGFSDGGDEPVEEKPKPKARPKKAKKDE